MGVSCKGKKFPHADFANVQVGLLDLPHWPTENCDFCLSSASYFAILCWGKLLLKVMPYIIMLIHKK